MAYISTVTKKTFKLRLDNGVDAQGNVKTLSMTYPALSLSGFTLDKAGAIAEAIRPCLTRTVYDMQMVDTSDVEEE